MGPCRTRAAAISLVLLRGQLGHTLDVNPSGRISEEPADTSFSLSRPQTYHTASTLTASHIPLHIQRVSKNPCPRNPGALRFSSSVLFFSRSRASRRCHLAPFFTTGSISCCLRSCISRCSCAPGHSSTL